MIRFRPTRQPASPRFRFRPDCSLDLAEIGPKQRDPQNCVHPSTAACEYILRENIEIVPLYFAAERPTVIRDGLTIMVDDDRFPLNGETPVARKVRFRTLGCYPLSGAVESEASTIEEVVAEMLLTTTSERQGRAIDKDAGSASMEKKKKEGYF